MPCLAILILFTFIFTKKTEVYAATGFSYYSYNDIYSKLPAKYKKSEYIYNSNNIPLICFATYNDKDYNTSVKKTNGKSDLIYCCDYSKHIIFDDSFSANNKMFNNKLRARIGLALYYGTTKWGTKAKDEYTTGNFITDYYMTQIVIHSLIYKYGGDLSNYGINFNDLKFKDNTDAIKKKTKALYDYCCKASITMTDGNFQSPKFSFKKPNKLGFTKDKDYLYTPYITCNSDLDGAKVKDFTKNLSCSSIPLENISLDNKSNAYNSDFRIKIPIQKAEQLEPGVYDISVNETVNYERYIAGFWKSSNSANQETTGLITNKPSANDKITFRLVIGDLSLEKKDSFTGEIISDAVFELYQYNDQTNSFEVYKRLEFNNTTKKYESGNIYVNSTNSKSRFIIKEIQAGKNYENDWDGKEFQLTETVHHFEFSAENKPVLGSLEIRKNGENIDSFENSKFIYKTEIPLDGITFSLFADSDIYKKDKILFKKGQKITDFVTDKSGEAKVKDLPMGDYYFKETKTLDIYELDPKEYRFSIERDNNKKYTKKTYNILNVLKRCSIHLYKYDETARSEDKQIPLPGARFGIYCAENVVDAGKKMVLEKDSLIAEMTTDEKGQIVFSDLPYADYYVKELEAPEGYIINDGIVTIKKNEFEPADKIENKKDEEERRQNNDTNEELKAAQNNNSKDGEKEIQEGTKKDSVSGRYSKYIDIANQKQHFRFKIHKYGEYFANVEKLNSDNGDYFQYNLQSKPLENVVFGLYTEDDTLIAKKETDSEGNVIFSDLEPGKYYYIEEACPGIYEKNDKKTEVIIEPDKRNQLEYFNNDSGNGETIDSQPIIETSVYNKYCNVLLDIQKYGESVLVKNKAFSYKEIPLANIVFGIYQNFDYSLSSDNVVPKNTCLGYLVTKVDGTASYSGKLPEGQYYLREIKTNAGYDLDNKLYYFGISANNNKPIEIEMDNHNTFLNCLSKASVQILKTDANTGKPLKGVEFTLYNDKDEIIGVYKTDKKGKIAIKELPYGKYYFIESKAKRGYYSTNNKYNFELKSSEGVSLNITNAPILKLGFEEHYKHMLSIIFFLITAFGGMLVIKNARRRK